MVRQRQVPIDLQPLFEALEKPLGLVSDPERRRQYEDLLANARPHQERAILNLISNLVAALNDASPGLRASVQLQGDGYVLNVERDSEAEEEPPVFDADEVERVTLRLPKELKDLIDKAAEHSGHSSNSWYIRTLARSIVRHMDGEHGPDIHGWGFRVRRRRREHGPDSD